MAEPRLISDYRAALAAELPARIVEELTGGVTDTYRHHLAHGLGPDAAATAALAEFGDPQVIAAAFTSTSHARRTARTLVVTGPAVGACWATALISARAWAWPVPPAARVLFAIALAIVIALLATAALSRRYRPMRRAAAAGCAGTALIDAALLSTALLTATTAMWPLAVAMAASMTRLTFATRNLHHTLTG